MQEKKRRKKLQKNKTILLSLKNRIQTTYLKLLTTLTIKVRSKNTLTADFMTSCLLTTSIFAVNLSSLTSKILINLIIFCKACI